jgi:hypothetical protein
VGDCRPKKTNLSPSCKLFPMDAGWHWPSQEKGKYEIFWKIAKSPNSQGLLEHPKFSCFISCHGFSSQVVSTAFSSRLSALSHQWALVLLLPGSHPPKTHACAHTPPGGHTWAHTPIGTHACTQTPRDTHMCTHTHRDTHVLTHTHRDTRMCTHTEQSDPFKTKIIIFSSRLLK